MLQHMRTCHIIPCMQSMTVEAYGTAFLQGYDFPLATYTVQISGTFVQAFEFTGGQAGHPAAEHAHV